MRDGVLYVGMLLRTLKEAKNKVAETYNYLPPSIRKKDNAFYFKHPWL